MFSGGWADGGAAQRWHSLRRGDRFYLAVALPAECASLRRQSVSDTFSAPLQEL